MKKVPAKKILVMKIRQKSYISFATIISIIFLYYIDDHFTVSVEFEMADSSGQFKTGMCDWLCTAQFVFEQVLIQLNSNVAINLQVQKEIVRKTICQLNEVHLDFI